LKNTISIRKLVAAHGFKGSEVQGSIFDRSNPIYEAKLAIALENSLVQSWLWYSTPFTFNPER